MGLTGRIAEFVAETSSDVMPDQARLQARRAILDTLGVSLAGSHEPASRIVGEYVREQRGAPEAVVAGHSFRAPASEAAMVNGTSGHALDFDDVSVSVRGHPSVPLMPAVLALGEKLSRSGREVAEAYVIGFEVQARLGRAIGEHHYGLGWHATSTFGTLGAAAASARLLRLGVDRTQAALGIAASLASGLQQNFGTMTKPLHAGWAARNGIIAASLAQRGVTADARALEGDSGFFRAMSGGAEVDPRVVTADLGKTWDIVSPGIGVKLYPCCYATHRAIDATLEIRERHVVDASQVDRVVVTVSPGTLIPLIERPPETGLEGKFSLAYCIAAALLDRRVSLASFSDAAVRRTEAQALLRRIEAAESGPPAEFPIGGVADVHVFTAGGEYASTVEVPRGDPRRPLTWEELVAKFRECAGVALNAARVEEALRLIEGIEGLADVRELGALLAVSESGKTPVEG